VLDDLEDTFSDNPFEDLIMDPAEEVSGSQDDFELSYSKSYPQVPEAIDPQCDSKQPRSRDPVGSPKRPPPYFGQLEETKDGQRCGDQEFSEEQYQEAEGQDDGDDEEEEDEAEHSASDEEDKQNLSISFVQLASTDLGSAYRKCSLPQGRSQYGLGSNFGKSVFGPMSLLASGEIGSFSRQPTMKPISPWSARSSSSTQCFNPFLVAMSAKNKPPTRSEAEAVPQSFMALALQQQEQAIRQVKDELTQSKPAASSQQAEGSQMFRKRQFMQ